MVYPAAALLESSVVGGTFARYRYRSSSWCTSGERGRRADRSFFNQWIPTPAPCAISAAVQPAAIAAASLASVSCTKVVVRITGKEYHRTRHPAIPERHTTQPHIYHALMLLFNDSPYFGHHSPRRADDLSITGEG
jgi:hypothetical protein